MDRCSERVLADQDWRCGVCVGGAENLIYGGLETFGIKEGVKRHLCFPYTLVICIPTHGKQDCEETVEKKRFKEAQRFGYAEKMCRTCEEFRVLPWLDHPLRKDAKIADIINRSC